MVRQAHHERRPEDFEKALAKPPLPQVGEGWGEGYPPFIRSIQPRKRARLSLSISQLSPLALIVPYWNLVGQPLTQ